MTDQQTAKPTVAQYVVQRATIGALDAALATANDTAA
jgi:hypothetical protein